MVETLKVCSNCSHFGPNKLAHLKYRLTVKSTCLRTHMAKPVTWNPEKKGCEHFDEFYG